MILLPEQGPSPLIFAIAIMIPPFVFWTTMGTKWPPIDLTISDAEQMLYIPRQPICKQRYEKDNPMLWLLEAAGYDLTG